MSMVIGKQENVKSLLRPLPSLVTLKGADPLIGEQYRMLFTRLLQLRKSRAIQVIGITSAIQGEGKTTTSFNLAITMAKAYQVKTLLIEADTRNSIFHSMMTGSNGTGLTDALAGWEHPSSLFQYTLEGKLGILSAGHTTEKTTVHFTAERLLGLVDNLREEFEFILMDGPPVLMLADMNILGQVVDGILYVVRAHQTPRSLVSKGLSMLPPEKMLGLVFNNHKATNQYNYYYYKKHAREGS